MDAAQKGKHELFVIDGNDQDSYCYHQNGDYRHRHCDWIKMSVERPVPKQMSFAAQYQTGIAGMLNLPRGRQNKKCGAEDTNGNDGK